MHYCGNISLYSYYGKQYGVSLKTTNRTTICYTKLTLCIYLREMSMGSQIDSCHPMFIAALVKIVKIWKQPVSNTGIEPRSPALYAYSSPSEPPGKPKVHVMLVKKEKQEKTGKQNFIQFNVLIKIFHNKQIFLFTHIDEGNSPSFQIIFFYYICQVLMAKVSRNYSLYRSL